MLCSKPLYALALLAVATTATADNSTSTLTFAEHVRIARSIERLKLKLQEAELQDKLDARDRKAQGAGEALDVPLRPVTPVAKDAPAQAMGAVLAQDRAPAYELESVFGIAGDYSAIFSRSGRKTVPMRVGDVLPGGLRVTSIALRSAQLRDQAGKEQVVTLSSNPEPQAQYPMIGANPQVMLPYPGMK